MNAIFKETFETPDTSKQTPKNREYNTHIIFNTKKGGKKWLLQRT